MRRLPVLLAGALALGSLALPSPSGALEPADPGARPRVLLLGDSTMAAASWYDGQGVTRSGDVMRERFDIDLDAESCRRIIHRSCTGFDRVTGARYIPPNVLDELRLRAGQQFDALVVMAGYDEYDLGPAVPAVMEAAARLGVKRVYWLTFRTTTSYRLPGGISAAGLYERLNGQLRQQAVDYPNLVVLEWDEATKGHCNQSRNPGSGLPGTGVLVASQCWFWWDGIHMTPDGAVGLMTWLRDQITADGLARCVTGGGEVPAATGPPLADLAPAYFHAVDGRRVLDTSTGAALAGGRRVRVALDPPPGATSALVQVAAQDACGSGYLSAQPCTDGAPATSTVNVASGQTSANSAVVPVGSGGEICVYSSTTTDVTVDLHGWFGTEGYRYSPLGPSRVLDTRVSATALTAGETRHVALGGLPTDAASAWLSVTGVGPFGVGDLSVHRCGTEPLATVHLDGGAALERIVASTAVVELDGGEVCVTAGPATHVVVDVFGTFGPSGALQYVAAGSPTRIVDTRTGAGTLLTPGGTASWATAGAADLVNATLVGPWGDGYLTVHPCGSVPFVSNANAQPFGIVPTLAVAASSASGACATTSAAAHVVVDRLGWFA